MAVHTTIEACKSGASAITFRSKEHRDFYMENLLKCRHQDVYHKALIYCLGINRDTRCNVNKIYDFKTGYVKTECLQESWQTSGNKRTVRMAFNIKAFRNNYYISDLVKMNLDYHAIEVGTVSAGSLTMESEFGERQDNEINGFDIVEDRIPTNTDELKVYDVVLAGVCR